MLVDLSADPVKHILHVPIYLKSFQNSSVCMVSEVGPTLIGEAARRVAVGLTRVIVTLALSETPTSYQRGWEGDGWGVGWGGVAEVSDLTVPARASLVSPLLFVLFCRRLLVWQQSACPSPPSHCHAHLL